MLCKMPRYRLNAGDHARFKFGLPECRFHLVADLAPFSRRYVAVNPAVGHDLYGSVGKQKVNQESIVVFGVPYAHLRKKLDCPFSRGLPPQ